MSDLSRSASEIAMIKWVLEEVCRETSRRDQSAKAMIAERILKCAAAGERSPQGLKAAAIAAIEER